MYMQADNQKGIFIIGIGENYLQMALNLCLSIRSNGGHTYGVTLLHTGVPSSFEQYLRYFTSNIDISEHVKSQKLPLHKAMYAKLLAYDLSPYEQTILLDADSLVLPGKSLEGIFNSNQAFMAMTPGYYHIDKSLNKYTWWCDRPEAAMTHFGVPLDHYMPQINASLLYFNKSAYSSCIFADAKKVWADDKYTGYTKHHRSKTEEFCFNVACAMQNHRPTLKGDTYYPVFIEMYNNLWSKESVYESYSIISLAGAEMGNENNNNLARWYEQLSDYYRRKFGVIEKFTLNRSSKSRPFSVNIQVRGYWHVYAVNNWMKVVSEQIQIMLRNGLYDSCKSISVGFIGSPGDLSRFLKLISNYDYMNIVNVLFSSDVKDAFEYPTLEMLKSDSDAAEDEFYGFYIHTKGVTKLDDNCKNWRDHMNHYVLNMWRVSVAALHIGKEVTGCNWLPARHNWRDHFSGNFFWFRSNYTKTLRPIMELKRDNRYEAEMWICSGEPRIYELSNKPNNAPNSSVFFPTVPIGVFFSGDLRNPNTEYLYSRLRESGIFEEAEHIVFDFEPKKSNLYKIAADAIINSAPWYTQKLMEDWLGHKLTMADLHNSWLNGSREDRVTLYIPNITSNLLAAEIADLLIDDWKYCYNRLKNGYSSVGIMISGDGLYKFAGDACWSISSANTKYGLPSLITQTEIESWR